MEQVALKHNIYKIETQHNITQQILLAKYYLEYLGSSSGTEAGAGATSGRRGGGREGVEDCRELGGRGKGWNRDGLWEEEERASPILALSMLPSDESEGKFGESLLRPVAPSELHRLTSGGAW